MAQLVVHLPSKYEALCLNPYTEKKNTEDTFSKL
jgi:hypothetical protein